MLYASLDTALDRKPVAKSKETQISLGGELLLFNVVHRLIHSRAYFQEYNQHLVIE